ncbi:MAG: hemoglobin/transferrin/lactoferrin receptor protein [Acidobacteriota bacterium]|nr:hemoglobin/transferrin/lactoferrin receptor protein [Acidobacteriota bacterium]
MRSLILAALLLAPRLAAAWDGVLLLPDGRAAADSYVSISGVSGSARTDSRGRFTLGGDHVPLTLIVVGPGGEIYPAVTVAELPPDGALTIRLEHGLQETVTVTSGVAPNIEASPAAATSVIGREELEQRRPEHLADALARTPGIQIRGEGPPAVPVVRGLAGGRTLLMLDGVRVTAERRAGPSGTFLDPFALGSIEVSRGPGSVAYGSDALGGIVHARPVDPAVGQPTLRYELSQSLGGVDRRSAGIELTRDALGGAFLALLHARDANDSEAGNGQRIPNSSYSDAGGALRFVKPTSTGALRVGLAVNRARDTGAPAADALLNPTYYPEENSERLTIGWDSQPSRAFDSLEVLFGLGSYGITTNRERLPILATTRQITSATVDANDVSLRVTGTRFLSSGRLVAGADFNSRFNLRATGFVQAFNATDAPTARTDELSIDDAFKRDTGLFVIYDHDLASRLVLSGGARVDRVSVENRGGFFGDRSREDTAFSGYVSLAATLAPEWTATIQASRGYRDPTLSDRYFRGVSGRGFVVGNPELDPEHSLQFDGALRWHSGQRSFALLGYQYQITDLVERFRAGNDFQFRNRGEAEVQGIEVEFATPLPLRFFLEANLTLARGEAVDDDAPLDDIPGPNAHVGLHWAASRATAFLYAFAFAEDDRPGPVETRRPGNATFDAGFTWQFARAIEARVYMRNLGDRVYAGSPDANASLAAGRSVSVALGGRY